MIKPIQSTQKVTAQPFKKTEAKKMTKNDLPVSPELLAERAKFSLACVMIATDRFGDPSLKQKLANAVAQKNYAEACLK